ncbi:MAG: hypothetical protein KY429_00905 [Actinobacteria bacterium]|nr:hypothetical protein [Actinomycetota bacterium]
MIEKQAGPLRLGAIVGSFGAAITVATGIAFLVISDGLDEPTVSVWAVASTIFLLGLCALLGVVVRAPNVRALLLGAATPGLFVVGVLGLFSIGLPLIVAGHGVAIAGVLELTSAGFTSAKLKSMVIGALLSVGLLVTALYLSRPPLIECMKNGVRTSGAVVRSTGESRGGFGIQEQRGTLTLKDGSVLRYRCEGEELVELREVSP